MRRIKIGHQMREHGGKKEERIKHKSKKQIKTERWYSLVAGRKRRDDEEAIIIIIIIIIMLYVDYICRFDNIKTLIFSNQS
jgi:hypothetical protein